MADLLKNVGAETPQASVEAVPAEADGSNLEQASEQGVEVAAERAAEPQEDPGVTSPVASSQSAGPRASVQRAAVKKDHVTIKVEQILEEGLGEMYATLSPEAQAAFRERGEVAAKEISDMVRTFRVRLSRVLRLVRDWLLTIPKVNKFFLEQEAKIKTDKIVELAQAHQEDLSKQP